MKVMVILIVVVTLGTFVKGLERTLEEFEIRGRIESTLTCKDYNNNNDNKSNTKRRPFAMFCSVDILQLRTFTTKNFCKVEILQ